MTNVPEMCLRVGNLLVAHRSTITTLYNSAFESSAAVFFIKVPLRAEAAVDVITNPAPSLFRLNPIFCLLDPVRTGNLSAPTNCPLYVGTRVHNQSTQLVCPQITVHTNLSLHF